MDSYTAGDVAELLGVSLPAVHRLAARLHMGGPRKHREHRRFTGADIERMVSEIGAVPEHMPGFSRQATLILAVLSRRPRGIRSARAAARSAGVSHTTASRVLHQLESRGLARREARSVIDPVPREILVWLPDVAHPEWGRIAPALGKVRLPKPSEPRQRPGDRVPRDLWYLFWNGDPRQLDVDRDAGYIASRLLLSDDPGAYAWALSHLPGKALASVATLRGASPQQQALALNLARAADR